MYTDLVRFEVFTVADTKNIISWHVTPCSLVEA
jgi:hypothetical protein